MRYLWSILGLFLSTISVIYFFRFVPDLFIVNLINHWRVIAVSMMVLPVAYFFRAYKTCLLLQTQKKDRLPVAFSLYTSIAMNNFLPFRLGDVFRIFYFKKSLKIDVAQSTGALIVERVLDLLTILVLFVVFEHSVAVHYVVTEMAHHVTFKIISAAVVLLFAMLLFRQALTKILTPLVKKINLTPRRLIEISLVTLLQWLIEISLLSVIVSYLIQNIVLGEAIASAFMSNLATLLPSAPGYVGTFEVVGLIPFQLQGKPVIPEYLLFVLIYHITIWVFSTALGLLSGVFLMVHQYVRRKMNVHVLVN